MRVPPVLVRRSGDRPAVRAGVPAAGWRAGWELVRTAGAARRAGRAAPADPAGRLSVPCSCGGGAGPAAGTPSRRYRRPDADGGGLAGALAGLPHRHRAVDRARLCRARAPVPGPVPGEVLLGELPVAQVQTMFAAIIRQHQALGTPVSAATLTRIRATLRAALNAAIRRGLLTENPAAKAELPRARRPRAVVWTP